MAAIMAKRKTGRLKLFQWALMAGMVVFILTACGSKQTAGPGEDARNGGTTLGLQVARTASSQIGKPYKYGGASPQDGFDCSGIIYWAYGQHGVRVPRVSAEQFKTGQAVSRDKLAPGDIMVFGEASIPFHAGIYTGDNKFVHSLGTGHKVRIESLNTPPWNQMFMTGRRVITEQHR
jgi:cell wall-associated NlpC family hydrolase